MKGFWGIILVVAGILFLGQSFNLINDAELETIFRFWPLLLVLFGLWLLVKGLKFAAVIMGIGLLLSALFVYSTGFTNSPLFERFNRDSRSENRGGEVKNHRISAEVDESIESIEAEINTGAIKFEIENNTDKLIEGNLISSFLDPDLETDVTNGVAKIKLDTVSFRRRFFFQDFRNELKLKLNADLPLALKVSTGASELDFDLSKHVISRFDLNAGASDIDIKFGENIQNGAVANFEAGVSNIKIEVPKSVGVKISSESGLSGEDYQGFSKREGAYYSEGYDTATKKIEIVLRAGASSIKINRY